MKRSTKIQLLICAPIVLVTILLLLWNTHVEERVRYTCVICRLTRQDTSYFGFTSERLRETACSEWYEKNVEPKHEHAWLRFPSWTRHNIFGSAIAVASSLRGKTLFSITPEEQREIYEHFGEPGRAADIFLGLLDENTVEEGRDWDIVSALKSWRRARFEGSWKDHLDTDSREDY